MSENPERIPEKPQEQIPEEVQEQPLEIPPIPETEKKEEHLEKELKEAHSEVEKAFTEQPQEIPAQSEALSNEVPVTESKQEKVSSLKKLGIGIGKSLSWITESLKKRTESFEVECAGQEHLEGLKEKPYIIAPNHLKPSNIIMRALGLSPDSFIVAQKVHERTQQEARIVTNVTGKIRKIPLLGLIDKILSPIREGIMEGMGFLPVRRDNRFNRNFVEKTKKALQDKEPVIMFPEGHWYEKFSDEHPFQTGVATTARNNEVPVVPVYIEGGRRWKQGTKAFVEFGAPIETAGKNKEQITKEIKAAMSAMEQSRRHENE